MECFPNAHICFCAEHRFCRSGTNSALTCGWGCDMINVLGRIFPALFFVPSPRASAAMKWPPTSSRGSFQFLGFDHWVTSLSAGSTGLFWFGWNPFRKHSCSSACVAIGIYVKRKKWKAQPAGVITISGITFFRTISLPCFKPVYKTGFHTNNFRNNGIKQRNRLFRYWNVDFGFRLWYDDYVGALWEGVPFLFRQPEWSGCASGKKTSKSSGPNGVPIRCVPKNGMILHLTTQKTIKKKPHRSPTPRTILRLQTHHEQFGPGPCPAQKMTLGDSVNNRQGSFPFRFGI